MELNPILMRQYADFLEESSRQIVELCNQIEGTLEIASGCMDEESGRDAAARLYDNMETIKKNVPIEDDAVRRLVYALKYVEEAKNVYRR